MIFLLRSIILSLILVISTNAQMLEEMRAVKLTDIDSRVLYTDENIAEAMDYLASIGINAVLPVVLNGGYTQYPSAVMDSLFGFPIDPEFSGRDPFQTVITEAHRVGIEVYPWFEYGFASYYSGGTAPFGGHILQQYPHWALRTKNGNICTKNGFDWLSGINPEVQDYILKLVIEVMGNYDVDGIEFSDRIPAMPFEGGYDSVTVAIYKAEHDGNEPPQYETNAAWMRWRADKLNEFYQMIRDTVKGRSENLFVASSPSIYPWAYEQYLQDSKTWVNNGIVDHFIPQLYRYNLQDYTYELNNAIQHTNVSKRETIFAGILMNVGSYITSPKLLLDFMRVNREKGLQGEAFFFYEGLRKNNNLLGDTLKATYYSEPAIIPLRDGNWWRPKAVIVNEDDDNAEVTGNWQTFQMSGYEGTILYTYGNDDPAIIEYTAKIPHDAYYDVYVFNAANTTWTDSARYIVRFDDQDKEVIFAQNNMKKKRWQKISEGYFTKGTKKVVYLDNSLIDDDEYMIADAVMIMMNRKLSDDIYITGIPDNSENNVVDNYQLMQNYPNPFNPVTTISFTLPTNEKVSLRVYDALGREVTTIVDEHLESGSHSFTFNGDNLASGIYFYRIIAGTYLKTKKMILLK